MKFNRPFIQIVAVLGLLVLMLAGCASLPPAPQAAPVRSLTEPTAAPTATAIPEPTQEPTAVPDSLPRGGDTVTIGGRPTALIERAKAEVAKLARSSADSVQVVNVESVDWSDSSLGCPKGGMMYAQVITPGYRIVLASGDQTYEFHTTNDPAGPLVQCGAK
ncbi:MAG: hypothetical protein WBO46_22755 [Caldilineaceae bacterium]